MELRVLLLLPLCFPGLQAQTPDAEESGFEGSTLSIQCPYTAETDHYQQKSWWVMREGQYKLLVETPKPTEHPYITQATNGKVTIQDDARRRTVNITITNVQAEDSGTYNCAYLSSHRYFRLQTISLKVFKELHKWELDSVSVQCPYSTLGYSTATKAWCRGDHSWCNVVVKTDYTPMWRNSKALEARTLIKDYTQNRTVTITMEKLQAQDTGVYWCALYRGSRYTQIEKVKLTVSKRTQQHTAEQSGNVSVQCPYSAPHYGAVSKAWCKLGATEACTVLVNTKSSTSGYLRTAQQGRVTIQDDTRQGVVTVTMEKLQAEDSGVYWCALYEQRSLFRMVEVTLHIVGSPVLAEAPLPVTAGTSQSTPSGNTPPPSSNVNTFILLSGALSILFILALIGLITLCIRWHKQLKRKGTTQAEDIYDKPEDIAQLDITERKESPTDDNKDLKYVTLNFKSQLSPEDPLYCNVEPSQSHRKPEDENVEYAVIALKQLPTNDKG